VLRQFLVHTLFRCKNTHVDESSLDIISVNLHV
jgi:hypothetical protein